MNDWLGMKTLYRCDHADVCEQRFCWHAEPHEMDNRECNGRCDHADCDVECVEIERE